KCVSDFKGCRRIGAGMATDQTEVLDREIDRSVLGANLIDADPIGQRKGKAVPGGEGLPEALDHTANIIAHRCVVIRNIDAELADASTKGICKCLTPEGERIGGAKDKTTIGDDLIRKRFGILSTLENALRRGKRVRLPIPSVGGGVRHTRDEPMCT